MVGLSWFDSQVLEVGSEVVPGRARHCPSQALQRRGVRDSCSWQAKAVFDRGIDLFEETGERRWVLVWGGVQMMELKSASLYSRFAKYYRDAEGVDYRTLIKAYGIRFDVMVNGKVRSQARIFQSLERKRWGTFLGGKAALG